MAQRNNAENAGAAVGCDGTEPVRASSGNAGTDEVAAAGDVAAAVVVADGLVPDCKPKMLAGGTVADAADGMFTAP